MTMGSSGITEVVGVVLAGGHSRRMGRDKALLEVAGQPLLQRPLSALQGVFEETVVVSSRRPGYDRFGIEVLPDCRPDLGPVGGLHTALIHAEGRAVFLLACDLPFVDSSVVRFLACRGDQHGLVGGCEPWRRRAAARVPVDRGRVQPLCGLYGGGCLARVERALDQGRHSAHRLLEELETERVELDRTAPWYHADLFLNINAAEDYARFQARLAAR